MKKVFPIIFIFTFILFLAGCASLMEQARIEHCNTNAAYAQGVNDAQARHSMQKNYGAICEGNVQAINEAYRNGYMTMKLSKPKKHLIKINIGHGYSKVDDKWQCIDTPFKSVCGYDCLQSSFNETYCGERPGDNCVMNRFNQVKCGRHCHAQKFGSSIICEIERYSNSSDRP